MLTTFDLQQRFQEFGNRFGEELGAKLAEKLSALGANQPAPRQFKGGVAFAELSKEEAAEFVEVLPLVGEYVESAAAFAADGISMHDYVQSRIYDETGCPMAGAIDTITGTMRAAMKKQSALFAAKFPVRQFG